MRQLQGDRRLSAAAAGDAEHEGRAAAGVDGRGHDGDPDHVLVEHPLSASGRCGRRCVTALGDGGPTRAPVGLEAGDDPPVQVVELGTDRTHGIRVAHACGPQFRDSRTVISRRPCPGSCVRSAATRHAPRSAASDRTLRRSRAAHPGSRCELFARLDRGDPVDATDRDERRAGDLTQPRSDVVAGQVGGEGVVVCLVVVDRCVGLRFDRSRI